MRSLAVFFALAVGVSSAAEKKADKKAPSIDGTWVITSIETNGEKKKDFVKDNPTKIVIAGGKWKVVSDTQTGSGAIKIDAAKKPAQVEVTNDEGPFTGKTLKGIIEFKGDTMRACYDTEGTGFPKAFSTKDEPTYLLFEYKREKK